MATAGEFQGNKAHLFTPAAREPRAVNRGQSVSLAVCEGASLCGGVLLKGPGRSRPGAEGAGSSRLGFAGAEMKARGPFSGWRFLCPLQAASATFLSSYDVLGALQTLSHLLVETEAQTR